MTGDVISVVVETASGNVTIVASGFVVAPDTLFVVAALHVPPGVGKVILDSDKLLEDGREDVREEGLGLAVQADGFDDCD
jgi:hypothetical protein